MKTLTVLTLAAFTAMASAPVAQAFPIAPKLALQTDAAQSVQFTYERGEARKNFSGCSLPYCGQGYRHDRRGYDRDDYYRDNYRSHYRHHDNDFGAFVGGLAAGAIIGGLSSQPRYESGPRVVSGSPHVRWCYARYRSYRASDNTFQPYSGFRRQCYSPY